MSMKSGKRFLPDPMFVISGIVAGEAKEGIVLRRMIRIVRILQMKRRMLQLMGIPQRNQCGSS
jgi:hypothetical protein